MKQHHIKPIYVMMKLNLIWGPYVERFQLLQLANLLITVLWFVKGFASCVFLLKLEHFVVLIPKHVRKWFHEKKTQEMLNLTLHEKKNFRLGKICEKDKEHNFVSFRQFSYASILGNIIFSELSFKRKCKKQHLSANTYSDVNMKFS